MMDRNNSGPASGGDNKNLILAIALSIVVLLGWQYFFGMPAMKEQRDARQASQTQSAQTGTDGSILPNAAPREGGPSTPNPATLPGTDGGSQPPMTREAALGTSPRVRIDSPQLVGSVSLKGGRVDDVKLRTYHETVDRSSPEIVLLSPAGSPEPYYAEFGWVAGSAGAGPMPGPDTVWTANGDVLSPDHPLGLTWDNGQGLVFRRSITIDDKTMFTVADTVENKGATPVILHPYGLVSRYGKPTTQGYYVLHEGLIGVLGDKGLQEVKYDAADKDPLLGVPGLHGQRWDGAAGGFVGITDKYWAAAVAPADQAATYQGSFTSRENGPSRVYQANVLADARTVQPGASTEWSQRLFAGAKEVEKIDLYREEFGIKKFDLLIDWGWFYFITKPLFKVLDFFYKLFGNFGISILIVTFILKLFFAPLANRSYVSMAKMKAIQPEMLSLRERFKDDRVKQQTEMMQLYKREKINPVAGCWPVLIQIPVFFALYKVLFVTIEMRHAPFFGWIRDLAAPDPTSIFNLFGALPFAPPPFLHIGVWPIIMGITMFFQMKMNPAPPDPVQKAMFSWMPVIFTFMLAGFPAGLVIYWAWNNTLSVTQQAVIMKRNGVKLELWQNLRDTFSRKPPAAAE